MKILLSIGGSDSSGGAGIQADIKTAEHFGVFSTTAITALTAQNTTGVQDIAEMDKDFVYNQIQSILDDFDVDAIKVGALFTTPIIEVVKEVLSKVTIPVVLDPIFISKSGSTLLKDRAIESIPTLFPYVTLITPNIYEAKVLFGEKLNIDAPCPVLVKNIKKSPKSIDRLFYANNTTVDFSSDFIDSKSVHGTGCSFSTALAANLALGKDLEEAIKASKDFISKAISQAPNIGKGSGPITHKIV